jgi:glycine/D-amino acid oxidase-like deaminating enzyme
MTTAPENPTALGPAHRDRSLRRMADEVFDILVVGGGVTGAGAALDAASRGLSVALIEARDYAAGASSKSSKLIHGGLRYLEQLNVSLVREALSERSILLQRLAPHLVRPVSFLFPLSHHAWERAYIGSGITAYDMLGFSMGQARGLPGHRQLTRKAALQLAPALKRSALTGAIVYWDAQVDDARYVMTLLRTAAGFGAHSASRTQVTGFLREGERVTGVRATDLETGTELEIRAQQVVNATGVWTDDIQEMVGGRGTINVRASKGPHPLQHRHHPADAGQRAVRHPVGPALDHRHHRYRLVPGQGASGRQPHRHRLRTRRAEQDPRRPAHPRRRGRGLRRAAPAAGGRVGIDLEAVPRARGRAPGPWPGHDRGRQVHDVPDHGP